LPLILRAPTPSAAAELIAPDGSELLRRIDVLGARIQREVRNQVDGQAQQLDMASEALLRGVRDRIGRYKAWIVERWAWLKAHRPDQILQLRRQMIAGFQQRIAISFKTAFEGRTAEAAACNRSPATAFAGCHFEARVLDYDPRRWPAHSVSCRGQDW
jgi:exonuclease VII large subunit